MKRISFTVTGVVLAIFVGAVLLFIFSNSAEPADASNNASEGAARILLGIFMPEFKHMSEAQQAREIASHQHLIRKLAHMAEYALLAALVTLLILQFANMDGLLLRVMVLAVVLCMLYAVTDEVHQLFVAGRTASPLDVLIDTGGAAIGSLAASALHLLVKKLTRR